MKTYLAKQLNKGKGSVNHKTLTIRQIWSNPHFKLHFAVFFIFNILLYIWIGMGHGLVRFNSYNYRTNSYHYIQDSRATGGSFKLTRALGQYDSQFFLKIADSGYTSNPKKLSDKQAYAFSPLYPSLIAIVHIFIPSLEMSALFVSQTCLLLCFVLMYWLVARWYSFELAAKSTWLLFLMPLSIFFRSYFSEGLFLLLLITFLHTVRSKKWHWSALSAGLLVLTRFIGIAAIIVLAGMLITNWHAGKERFRTVLTSLGISMIPLFIFMVFCHIKTGNPLYFIEVRSIWRTIAPPPFATLYSITHFWSNQWHYFHSSKVDVLSIILSGIIIVKSRRWLPRSWWYMSVLLWGLAFVSTDTMSAARYQVVNLPLFVYAASALPKNAYRTVVIGAALSLFWVSLYFINWYWVG